MEEAWPLREKARGGRKAPRENVRKQVVIKKSNLASAWREGVAMLRMLKPSKRCVVVDHGAMLMSIEISIAPVGTPPPLPAFNMSAGSQDLTFGSADTHGPCGKKSLGHSCMSAQVVGAG